MKTLHVLGIREERILIDKSVIVASEARDLLSDTIHFQCLGTHTHWSSFHMYTIPEGSGCVGLGAGFLSPISSQMTSNLKKTKNTA